MGDCNCATGALAEIFYAEGHTVRLVGVSVMARSVDYLERGIHGYFPFGRANLGRRLLPRRRSSAFELLEALVDTCFAPADWADFAAPFAADRAAEAALPRPRSRLPRRRATALRPGTRCTEPQHAQYYGRVNQTCRTAFSCSGADTTAQLHAKAAQAQACADARLAYQRRCFTPAHPEWVGHETQRAQARRASRHCWERLQARPY